MQEEPAMVVLFEVALNGHPQVLSSFFKDLLILFLGSFVFAEVLQWTECSQGGAPNKNKGFSFFRRVSSLYNYHEPALNIIKH